VRALLLRLIAVVILLAGLVCLLFPFVDLVRPGGPMLLDDTRAYFGAGSGEGVPIVHQVACMSAHYGGSGGRHGSPGMTEYPCDLLLAEDPSRVKEDPYAGMTYEEAMKEYDRRILAQSRGEGTFPDRIERTFSADVSTRPPPRLRLMSEAGVSPPRYGVVYDGAELSWRWLHWATSSLLFWGFGAACLFGARAGFRRARGESPI
jgi:hypothetical protein